MFANTATICPFHTPSADTLLRPDSMCIMLRSVPIRRRRVEFSRKFNTLVRPKSGLGASGLLNFHENSVLLHLPSVFSLVSPSEFARSRIKIRRVAKYWPKMCHPCVSVCHPLKGCTPFVYQGCVSVSPFIAKICIYGRYRKKSRNFFAVP